MLPLLLVLPLQWTASSRAVWSARPLRPLPTSPMLAAVLSSDDHDEEAGPPSATFLRTPAQRVLVNVERLGIEGQMLGLALEEDGLALLAEAKLDSELSLTLCDGPFIRELNTQWRGIDKETDVLSFPMDDDVILGDVVICVDVAQRQAWERDYELRDEARVLMVHGLLHLLGYDHETTEEDAIEMMEAEGRLLRNLGWKGEGLIAAAESRDD